MESIVLKFISNYGIMHGGMAIHFLLKIRGHDGIYTDDQEPDYDFYVPEIERVYDLTDELNASKTGNYQLINAVSDGTCRIKRYNDFIADISYMPQKVYDVIPKLFHEYKGFRIAVVGHKFMRAELHKIFLGPFKMTPYEPLYRRFRKDFTRFKLLDNEYPMELKYDKSVKTINVEVRKGDILTGIIAYGLIASCVKESGDFIAASFDGKILKMDYWVEEKPIYVTNKDVKITKSKFMENLIPASNENSEIILQHFESKISYDTVHGIDILNIHGLMTYFLIKSFYNKAYTPFYASLLNIIKLANKNNLDGPFYVSLKTFNNCESKNERAMRIRFEGLKNGEHVNVWAIKMYKFGEHPVIDKSKLAFDYTS
jgi:hypothetical protein